MAFCPVVESGAYLQVLRTLHSVPGAIQYANLTLVLLQKRTARRPTIRTLICKGHTDAHKCIMYAVCNREERWGPLR